MAYNRRNKLLQWRNVLAIYAREKREGVTTVHVHKEICKIYPMSRATLYNILATPVEKLLKEENAKQCLQASLF